MTIRPILTFFFGIIIAAGAFWGCTRDGGPQRSSGGPPSAGDSSGGDPGAGDLSGDSGMGDPGDAGPGDGGGDSGTLPVTCASTFAGSNTYTYEIHDPLQLVVAGCFAYVREERSDGSYALTRLHKDTGEADVMVEDPHLGSVAADEDGNVYWVDTDESRIWMRTEPQGADTELVGSADAGNNPRDLQAIGQALYWLSDKGVDETNIHRRPLGEGWPSSILFSEMGAVHDVLDASPDLYHAQGEGEGSIYFWAESGPEVWYANVSMPAQLATASDGDGVLLVWANSNPAEAGDGQIWTAYPSENTGTLLMNGISPLFELVGFGTKVYGVNGDGQVVAMDVLENSQTVVVSDLRLAPLLGRDNVSYYWVTHADGAASGYLTRQAPE